MLHCNCIHCIIDKIYIYTLNVSYNVYNVSYNV